MRKYEERDGFGPRVPPTDLACRSLGLDGDLHVEVVFCQQTTRIDGLDVGLSRWAVLTFLNMHDDGLEECTNSGGKVERDQSQGQIECETYEVGLGELLSERDVNITQERKLDRQGWLAWIWISCLS